MAVAHCLSAACQRWSSLRRPCELAPQEEDRSEDHKLNGIIIAKMKKDQSGEPTAHRCWTCPSLSALLDHL